MKRWREHCTSSGMVSRTSRSFRCEQLLLIFLAHIYMTKVITCFSFELLWVQSWEKLTCGLGSCNFSKLQKHSWICHWFNSRHAQRELLFTLYPNKIIDNNAPHQHRLYIFGMSCLWSPGWNCSRTPSHHSLLSLPFNEYLHASLSQLLFWVVLSGNRELRLILIRCNCLMTNLIYLGNLTLIFIDFFLHYSSTLLFSC